MKMLARSYLWWPGLDKDIEARVRRCDQCASVAAQESPVPLDQWESPEKPWCRLHADFAELHGNHYFVLVDAFSKWPEVVRMVSTTAIKTIEVLKDIFLHNGLPEVLVSDNGHQWPQFHQSTFRTFLVGTRNSSCSDTSISSQVERTSRELCPNFKSCAVPFKRGGQGGFEKFRFQIPGNPTCVDRPSTM
ncbi:uncharacterized protein K02A2.6-like [Ornithodoros turicata]|uniref:uncharacterized protein K02A2.6-like n=1 Tax=Ornithodoros turicata TaxID=34597 RepID=UPI00313A3AA7